MLSESSEREIDIRFVANAPANTRSCEDEASAVSFVKITLSCYGSSRSRP